MDIALNTHDESGHTVLAVAGEVDVYTAPNLRDRVTALLDAGKHHIVVDLSAVEFIDSTGLGVLVGTLNRARELGGELELVCAQERILKLLRITSLDTVFTVHNSVADAVTPQPAPEAG